MIKAENLTMHYGPVVALRDVSFEVRQGEIVGLLGPNGAGKSTTMKILTTYLHPTKGTAKVGGIDVLENPLGVRKIIGYLPEILPLYMDMEVKSYLQFVGKARGLSGARLRERTDVVVEKCGLRPMYRKVVRELSKGFKQRTALAQALIHDPDVIILDEPTSGLDPHQIVEVRELIKGLAHGKTVILSTHILHEVETTADRIVIISQGRIVGDGTLEQLRERATKYERTLVTVAGARDDVQRQLTVIEGARRVDFAGEENGFVSFLVHGKQGAEIRLMAFPWVPPDVVTSAYPMCLGGPCLPHFHFGGVSSGRLGIATIGPIHGRGGFAAGNCFCPRLKHAHQG